MLTSPYLARLPAKSGTNWSCWGELVSYVAIVYACRAAGTPVALDTSEVDEIRSVADLDGLGAARWLPPVHADAVRWWQERSVAAPGNPEQRRVRAGRRERT